jgi:hypothetical protein
MKATFARRTSCFLAVVALSGCGPNVSGVAELKGATLSLFVIPNNERCRISTFVKSTANTTTKGIQATVNGTAVEVIQAQPASFSISSGQNTDLNFSSSLFGDPETITIEIFDATGRIKAAVLSPCRLSRVKAPEAQFLKGISEGDSLFFELDSKAVINTDVSRLRLGFEGALSRTRHESAVGVPQGNGMTFVVPKIAEPSGVALKYFVSFDLIAPSFTQCEGVASCGFGNSLWASANGVTKLQ